MDVPLEIAFHNMESSESLEARIRERADRLHRHLDRINSCRVILEAPHRGRGGPQGYRVTIDVTVPGDEIVVSREPGDAARRQDAHLAIRDAFAAMEKRLEGHKEKRKREVKTHAPPLQGRVLRLFADYGFVGTHDGREIYFHRNAVTGTRFEDLAPEQPVELALDREESPQGPQATLVKPISEAAYDPLRPGG